MTEVENSWKSAEDEGWVCIDEAKTLLSHK